MQLTLTLKMTTTVVVETLVTINNNRPIQEYAHRDDQTQPTLEMTPVFKPFTQKSLITRQKESNVQYSQAADREIKVIPKNVSPVCNCCPLDIQWIIVRKNSNN